MANSAHVEWKNASGLIHSMHEVDVYESKDGWEASVIEYGEWNIYKGDEWLPFNFEDEEVTVNMLADRLGLVKEWC